MKKNTRILLLLLICSIALLVWNKVNAATSATVYAGESISIEKLNDVDIVQNKVEIDINTSRVNNDFVIKNKNNEDLITKVTVKLEDAKASFSIKDLIIKVNNFSIKNIEKNNDYYSFYIKLDPESYKKIDISYTTENDLKNAKVIKYSLNTLNGKLVRHFNIDVKIPEEDIPLVKKIYPECFEYADNNINVKYYDFTVNNLTKDFIIEKETYKNLIYGDDTEKDELQSKLYSQARELINTDKDFKWDQFVTAYYTEGDFLENRFDEKKWIANYFNLKLPTDYLYNDKYIDLPVFGSLLSFIVYKQANFDSVKKIRNTCVARYLGEYPITKTIIDNYSYLDDEKNLLGKKVCIDYVESEGDKELYIGSRGLTVPPPTKRFDEFELLRKKGTGEGERIYGPEFTYKRINVGLDISGNQIDATEAEKVDFINKIGADLYIRKVIYDGNVRTTYNRDGNEHEMDMNMVVAYYTDKNKEIASAYLGNVEHNLAKIQQFDNDIVSTNAKIPTIVSSVAYRTTENGKYMINYFNRFVNRFDALGNIYEAINTQSAIDLIQSNNEKNENIKHAVDSEISNAKLVDGTEEYTIPQEEKTTAKNSVEEKVINTEFNFSLNQTETIIISIIGGAILINIIAIIVGKNKKNKLKGDGRK